MIVVAVLILCALVIQLGSLGSAHNFGQDKRLRGAGIAGLALSLLALAAAFAAGMVAQ